MGWLLELWGLLRAVLCSLSIDYAGRRVELIFFKWYLICQKNVLYTKKALIRTFHISFWLQNNLCEFKFTKWFCTEKLVLNVGFKDYWYTKISVGEPELGAGYFLEGAGIPI